MNIQNKLIKLLITNSLLLSGCSEVNESTKSQSVIQDFTLKEYHLNKVEWQLKAQQAEVYDNQHSKIKDLQLDLVVSDMPLSIKSKQGSHGQKGINLQAPIQIKHSNLNITLTQKGSWNRSSQTLSGSEVHLSSSGFSGQAKKLNISYPYHIVKLETVSFKFNRD